MGGFHRIWAHRQHFRENECLETLRPGQFAGIRRERRHRPRLGDPYAAIRKCPFNILRTPEILRDGAGVGGQLGEVVAGQEGGAVVVRAIRC